MEMHSLKTYEQGKWTIILPRLAEAGLVLLLAWLVAGLLVGNGSMNTPVGFKQPDQSLGEAGVNVESLLKDAPFGKLTVIAAKPISTPSKAVVSSRLNIKLYGTVVTEGRSLAMVVARAGAPLEIYRIGDNILPGVTLSEVETARIVVKTASGFEEIWMEGSVGAAATASRLQKAGGAGQVEIASLQRVSRNEVERELSDLGKLMTQIRVTPYFEKGQMAGFMVSDIESGSIFERIGLLNDDVIQSVNGQSVTDPQQAMQMYQQLRNANQLDVVLIRNQHVHNVRYQIQ